METLGVKGIQIWYHHLMCQQVATGVVAEREVSTGAMISSIDFTHAKGIMSNT